MWKKMWRNIDVSSLIKYNVKIGIQYQYGNVQYHHGIVLCNVQRFNGKY